MTEDEFRTAMQNARTSHTWGIVYMTKHAAEGVQLPEIEITEAMIEAGVQRLRDFCFGEPVNRIVEAVYLAMAIERQCQTEAGRDR